MRKALWIVLALPVILGSCRHFLGKRIKGNGEIRTEERSVNPFKNVDVSGAAKVYVSQGSPATVKIEGDANLLQYIEVTQEGDNISVRERPGFNLVPTGDLNVYVTAPVFSKIAASGPCDIIGPHKISNSQDLSPHVTEAAPILYTVV